MSRLTVVPSCAADAASLAPRLRAADRDEVLAAAGRTPLQALEDGFAASADPQTVVAAGLPVAMFGIVPDGHRSGSPWLLGSDELLSHWFEFARRSREEFARARTPYDYLHNHVDARNELHVRWIGWLGFEFEELVPHYGVGRLPFWRFTLCATR